MLQQMRGHKTSSALFASLISHTFSVNEQCFSLTTNQQTILSVMAFQPSETRSLCLCYLNHFEQLCLVLLSTKKRYNTIASKAHIRGKVYEMWPHAQFWRSFLWKKVADVLVGSGQFWSSVVLISRSMDSSVMASYESKVTLFWLEFRFSFRIIKEFWFHLKLFTRHSRCPYRVRWNAQFSLLNDILCAHFNIFTFT
jgi:hypothetical protein